MSDILIPSLPSTTSSLDKKYKRLAPTLNQLPPSLSASLLQFDTQRAMRGAQPLSDKETAAVLNTALTGQAATPAPARPTSFSPFSVAGNAVHDIKEIATSLPRLPGALYKEARALPQAPGAISNAFQAGSLSKVLAGLTEAPGLRLVPGAYTVHNLATGHPGEILQHPVMSALDVAPYAHSLGVGEKLASTAAGEKLTGGISTAKEFALRTRPGQWMEEAFGNQSRVEARVKSLADFHLKQAVDARDETLFGHKYDHIPYQERQAITNALELGTPEAQAFLDALPPDRQGMVSEARLLTDNITKEGIVNGVIPDYIDGEIFDPKSAKKILKARSIAQAATEEGAIRDAVIGGGGDIPSLTEQGARVALQPGLSTKARVRYLQGITHALDSAGVDAGPLRATIRLAFRPPATGVARIGFDEVAQTFRDFSSTAAPAPALTPLPDIVTQLNPLARTDPKVARFVENIRQGQLPAAVKLGKDIAKRTTFLPPEFDSAMESLRAANVQKKFLDRPPVFDEKAIGKLTTRADRIFTESTPARFQPIIERTVADKLLVQYADHPDLPAITQAIVERHYATIPGLVDETQKLTDDVATTWQKMKEDGINPLFVHKVSPGDVSTLNFPKVIEHVPAISWAKKRTMDITPYVQDVTVALPHQAMELLRKQGSEEYINSFVASHGRHLYTAMGEKEPLIEDFLDRARLHTSDPKQVTLVAQQMMKKEWEVFDPSSIITWKGAKLSNFGKEEVYVPKSLAANLRRMHTPMENGFTAVMDPVMKLFRTSVLPLSPRWHVNNIVGGGMIVAAENPRIFGYLGKARDLINEGNFPEEVGRGLGMAPRDFFEWDTAAKHQFALAAGKTMGRIYQEAGKARELLSKGIEKSYEMNAWFDDTYRAAAFLEGNDRALTKGMTTDAAREAGITQARKILQRWDEMTPIERSVLRYVFPFYGWISHIMKYTLQYPFDHPYRAAIMGAFTRNEINDMGTGLPERFLNSFFIGKPDAKGNVKTFNVGAMNPFSNVADFFTLAGVTGSANPVLSTFLQTLGVDVTSGGPELFPNLTYDNDTGRLVAKQPGIFSTLVGNVIPQSRILTGMFDSSSQFQQILRTNPEAASRLLQSSAGLPIVFRKTNVAQEQFKAELARQDAQNQAKSAANKSGDIASLNKYPALRGYVAQIQALQQQGKLKAFTPPVVDASPGAALRQAALLQLGG